MSLRELNISTPLDISDAPDSAQGLVPVEVGRSISIATGKKHE